MKKWRVGLIGAGGVSKWAHIPAWKKIENVEVVAVSDVKEEVAKETAKKFDIPHVFSDYNQMLKMEELEIIDICAPNAVHHPAAIASFKAGKHVISEKPLAITPGQVEDMIASSKKTGKKLCCIQNHRFRPECQIIKKMIENGELGQIYYARAQALRRRLLPISPTFIKKEISGGGPCLDIGVHILDLTCWLMSFPKVKSISGVALTKLAKREDIRGDWGEWDRKAYDVEDFAAGFIKFDNNLSLHLECSFLLNMKESEIFSAHLFGTEAGVWLPSGQPSEIYTEKERAFMVKQLVSTPNPNIPSHEIEIRLFIESLEQNKPVPVPPEESLEVIKILDGIYRSSQTTKEIRFEY